ncbi:MAG: NAD(+) diphosphatase [Eubacteriaceae bacterium]|nr:NAD(+) diphosphatase [Eubacteriaceae bacterium]
MTYCEKCGTLLTKKEQPEDGMVPWCPQCQTYRYPGFNTAVSMIVVHPAGDRILVIDQYGKKGILVAGYVAKGESLEETVAREVQEETGLALRALDFNASQYYPGSNTLMVNFACRAAGETLVLNPGEVDRARWVPVGEVREAMRPHSLAKAFLCQYLDKNRLPG